MKVGLVPISAKPYHKGHHYLVEQAARENDEVIVFASTSDRKRSGEFPITGNSMIRSWNDLIIPNMRGIMQARQKSLTVITPVDCQIKSSISKFEKPAPKVAVKMVEPSQIDKLIDLLHKEAKVI